MKITNYEKEITLKNQIYETYLSSCREFWVGTLGRKIIKISKI